MTKPHGIPGADAAHERQSRFADEVQKERARLQEIVDSVPGIVWEVWGNPGEVHRLDFVSDYAEEMLGYSREEWLSTPGFWLQIVHPDDRKRTAAEAADIFASKKEGLSEFRLIHKNGRVRWVRARSVVILDERGAPVGMRGVTVDITHIKEAEEEAQKSRAQLEAVFQAMQDGVVVFDMKGNAVLVNEAEARINGYARVEDMMKDLEYFASVYELSTLAGDIVPVDDWPVSWVMRGETITNRELRGRRKDTGQEWVFSFSGQPLYNDAGEQILAVTITRDITVQKRSEERFIENQRRLEFLAEISESLASSIDYEETLKTIVNRMVPDLADWAAIDVLHDDGSVARLAVVHVDPAKMDVAHRLAEEFPYDPASPTGLARVLRTGKTEFIPLITKELMDAWNIDERRKRIVEDLQLHSYMLVPLIARGRTLGAITLVMAESGRKYSEAEVAFAEDIARRAAMAIDNARLYRDAQKALTIRDDFLSIASHELKTPVTSIKAFLQALENRMKDPQRFDFQKNRQYMQLSIKQIDRLAAIINDLLDINRINKGRMEYHFKVLPIGPVLSDAIERMSVSFPTHKLHMKLGELTAKVSIDELRFEQVLTNLITNAAKYSPEGSTIDIVTRSTDRYVYIDIIDRGMGISEEDQQKIFTRYYRTPEAVQARVSGLGVGLYISSELIQAHKGVLTVQSNLGEGSTFTIALPRAEEK